MLQLPETLIEVRRFQAERLGKRIWNSINFKLVDRAWESWLSLISTTLLFSVVFEVPILTSLNHVEFFDLTPLDAVGFYLSRCQGFLPLGTSAWITQGLYSCSFKLNCFEFFFFAWCWQTSPTNAFKVLVCVGLKSREPRLLLPTLIVWAAEPRDQYDWSRRFRIFTFDCSKLPPASHTGIWWLARSLRKLK